jgi:hypothetical protein
MRLDQAARTFIKRRAHEPNSARSLHVNVRRIVRDLRLVDADVGQADADGDGDGSDDPFAHGNLLFFQMEIAQMIATSCVNAVTDATFAATPKLNCLVQRRD